MRSNIKSRNNTTQVVYGISADTINLRHEYPHRTLAEHFESRTTQYSNLGSFSDYKASGLSYKRFVDRFDATAVIAALNHSSIPFNVIVRAENLKTGRPAPLPGHFESFDDDLLNPTHATVKWMESEEKEACDV